MTDLAGKTFLVTGANTGIGQATAKALAGRGATVFLACRSESKTVPVIEEINAGDAGRAEFLALDLGDLTSVRACAQSFLDTGQPLHGLINDAGIAGKRGLSQSGFEITFGTNHVGPFLLTSMLLDRVTGSAPSRIVNVASEAHYHIKGIDYSVLRERTKTRTGLREYAFSKLANVLHAQELARRLDGTGVTTYSLHPGAVASDIWRQVPWPIRPLLKMRMVSTEDGAKTTLYCATAPELANESGYYYEDEKRKPAARTATPENAAELWERSMAWTADGAGGDEKPV
jgi:NAD(P)-dependent dehydrogenase (short-subunit alcohol dehydrogenase family)